MKYTGINKHAVETAFFFAFKLTNSNYFNIEDREDIIQELVLEYLLNEHKYDVSRGTRKAFINSIIKSKALDLIKEKKTVSRGSEYNLISISAMENNHVELKGDDFTIDEVKIDVKSIISKLEEDELILAHFFMQDYSINEITKIMKIGKSKLYRILRNIKNKASDE